ncbi:hypothetical protein HK096_006424 [Nowakowskiella sp. JEL0078]|nr:hypothetical protein HK096_006424 [Nowakowskiella sp. JEL0078]
MDSEAAAISLLQKRFPRAKLLKIREALARAKGDVDAAAVLLAATPLAAPPPLQPVAVAPHNKYSQLSQALWSLDDSKLAGNKQTAVLFNSIKLARSVDNRRLVLSTTFKALLKAFPDVNRRYLVQLLDGLNSPDLLNAAVDVLAKATYPLQYNSKSAANSNVSGNDDVNPNVIHRPGPQLDWLNGNVPKSPLYFQNCNQQLRIDFPLVSANVIETTLANNRNQYCPTWLALSSLTITDQHPQGAEDSGGGGARVPLPIAEYDNVFWWELQYVSSLSTSTTSTMLVECGCCFADVPQSDTYSCSSANHNFCKACVRAAVNDHFIGMQNITPMPCIQMGGCTNNSTIADTAIRAAVGAKAYLALEKIRGQTSVERALAAVPGFTICPFCDFGALVDESADTKLFHCINKACRAISCVECKRRAHIPLTCKQMANSAIHIVAEAQTAALLRNCPSCRKPSFKIDGCNKITCVCGKYFCYVCRKAIDDYSHFGTINDGNCPLFDDTIERNVRDIREAGLAAAQEAQLDIRDMDQMLDVKNDDFGM